MFILSVIDPVSLLTALKYPMCNVITTAKLWHFRIKSTIVMLSSLPSAQDNPGHATEINLIFGVILFGVEGGCGVRSKWGEPCPLGFIFSFVDRLHPLLIQASSFQASLLEYSFSPNVKKRDVTSERGNNSSHFNEEVKVLRVDGPEFVRAHHKPRLCLFTPMKVANGPLIVSSIGSLRTT